MGLQQEIELLRIRSATARWLSGILAGLPCEHPETDQAEIETGSLADRMDTVRRLLPKPRSDDRENGSIDAREAERVRLFVNAPGGIPAPPYGSWWLEQTLEGRSTGEVSEFYGREGLKSHPGAGPADYLPSELEFVHFLIQHQVAAAATRQADLASQAARQQNEFMDRFMVPWVREFCKTGRKATEDLFWTAVLDLLEEFISSETERLEGSVTPER